MKTILLVLTLPSLISGCSGFKPVKLDHDNDKERLDYRDGDWMPKNS